METLIPLFEGQGPWALLFVAILAYTLSFMKGIMNENKLRELKYQETIDSLAHGILSEVKGINQKMKKLERRD